MNTKLARKILNMTQKEFAHEFSIPLRTIENWETGKSSPPLYVLKLLDFALKDRLKGENEMEMNKIDKAIEMGKIFAENLDDKSKNKIRKIILNMTEVAADDFINQLIEVGLQANVDTQFLIDVLSLEKYERIKPMQSFVFGITLTYGRKKEAI